MKRFWRKRVKNGKPDREVEESEERLKRTQERWTEVHQASQQLEKMIREALRGGAA